jgi:ubiquinone/menaquinone biosynthesis C-methylase UbiE
MNERVFGGEMERLRDPERVKMLELDRVVDLSLSGLKPQARVLDVGCGTALFAEAFARRGCKITGIDIKESMIAEAKRLVPEGEFRLGSAECLPFEDRSFAVVFFGLVLHETDDLIESLREAKRVASQRVIAIEWPYEKSDKGPPLEHRLTPERVGDAAHKAGLNSIESIRMKHLALYDMKIADGKS